MSSPADKLAAGQNQFNAEYATSHQPRSESFPQLLTKRDSTPAERLAAARQDFNLQGNGLRKRTASPREHLAIERDVINGQTAAERLAAAKEGLNHAKRDVINGQTAAERLAAAKDGLTHQKRDVINGHTAAERLAAAKDGLSLSSRDIINGQSAAERLAAAKDGLNLHSRDIINGQSASERLTAAKDHLNSLSVRDDPVQGNPELPVSNMQKTVIPLVIGIVLILLFGIVAGFIVYKRRQKNKLSEDAQHRRKHLDLEDDGADEDFEMHGGPRVQNVGVNGNGSFATANRAGGWQQSPELRQQQNEAGPRRRSSSLQKETA